MALDLIKLRLEGISIKEISSPSNWRTWRMEKKQAEYFRYGCLYMYHRKIKLKYRRAVPGIGQLLVSFNPTKLLYGDDYNSNVPVSDYRMCTILDEELKGVFNEEDFFRKRLTSIFSSISEIYVDVYGPLKDIMDYYAFLKRIKIPGMSRDDTFAARGTLYFHTAKTMGKSNKVFKVYLKHTELQHRGYEVDPTVGILRFEAVFKRRKLKADLRRFNQGTKSVSHIQKRIIERSGDKNIPYTAENDGTHDLNLLTSDPYQVSTLREFIEGGCHLDKRIATKQILLHTLQLNYPPNVYYKLVKVVEYLNEESGNIDMCPKTLNNYKKMILVTGYHFLYYKRELEPVDFQKSLSEHILMSDMESDIYMCDFDEEEEEDLDFDYEEPYCAVYL
jgi:hypothetical protein